MNKIKKERNNIINKRKIKHYFKAIIIPPFIIKEILFI